MEKTLVLIKPDAVSKNLGGKILAEFESTGLRLRGLKMLQVSELQARAFYRVHSERPFYQSLTQFLSSGPILAVVLEGKDAVSRVRALMGDTNPEKAALETIRRKYAESIERNAVHGSDGTDTAAIEIPFFFSEVEMPDG